MKMSHRAYIMLKFCGTVKLNYLKNSDLLHNLNGGENADLKVFSLEFCVVAVALHRMLEKVI